MLWALSLLDTSWWITEMLSCVLWSDPCHSNIGICRVTAIPPEWFFFFFLAVFIVILMVYFINVLKRKMNILFFLMNSGNWELIFVLKQHDSCFLWGGLELSILGLLLNAEIKMLSCMARSWSALFKKDLKENFYIIWNILLSQNIFSYFLGMQPHSPEQHFPLLLL